ncbi:LiaF transmembrane domain-containing protein [Pedobacter frigiditerrae]|uniref:LiaF transmembrane domain-containing protein n=1 Tax=Pedobacter frigiditerrae TaxID=2530452 RepID=UPI00292D31D7|nr:DUF5668 domain-containing protein [Pedobacter frigiditerrae]
MKFDKVIWGVLLLFIGGVLLLENFNVIDFYWGNVWDFWPVFIIIMGVNILFNRGESQTGSIMSLGILVVALGFLFFRGQERASHRFWWGNHRDRVDRYEHYDNNDDEDNDNDSDVKENYSAAFDAGDEARRTVLNLSGGGTSFKLEGQTDSLFTAQVSGKNHHFGITKTTSDSVNTVAFKMQDKGRHKSWNIGNGNDVKLYMNTAPNWELQLNMGAGSMDLDLTDYKVRTLNFDGGAAELDIKIGSLLPIADVNVKSGLADVKIKIPEGSGCRIKTKTGLSTKDFNGFTKLSDGVYETPNYKTSTNKIFINLDGGLSSFEVDRY